MGANYSIEKRDGYLHVRHNDPLAVTAELTGRMWPEIEKACALNNCNKILIEASVATRDMDTVEAFESGTRVAELAPHVSVAICFPGYKTDELTEFFETVARNRGAKIEFFDDVESAKDWLGID